VALAIAITILNVLVAAALPMWSTAMKREKEEELVFRGFQYAEGIRLFQRRFGRHPQQLTELIEVRPRCLRQLWDDPMTKNGKWGLIFANAPGAPAGRQPGDPGGQGSDNTSPSPPPGTDPGVPSPGREGEETVTIGPITGVRSLSTEESLLEFNGQSTYDAWQFTVGMVTGSIGVPGQPGGIPNLNTRWLGRPLRKGLTAPTGGGGLPTELQRDPNGGGPGNPPAPAEGDEGRNTRRRTLPNTLGGGRSN